MTLKDGVIDLGPVVGAVGGERADRFPRPVQQWPDLRGVVDVAMGQQGGDDPATAGVRGDMQLSPRPPLPGPVFLDQPFAGTAELEAGTVDQQMEGAVAREIAAGDRRQPQCPGPPAQGAVIRNRQINPEEFKDRADQPLGLAQRQAEDRAQGQGRGDGDGGIVRLAPRRGPRFCPPGRYRILGEPDR